MNSLAYHLCTSSRYTTYDASTSFRCSLAWYPIRWTSVHSLVPFFAVVETCVPLCSFCYWFVLINQCQRSEQTSMRGNFSANEVILFIGEYSTLRAKSGLKLSLENNQRYGLAESAKLWIHRGSTQCSQYAKLSVGNTNYFVVNNSPKLFCYTIG